jgi:hypothetical protein
MRTFLPLLAFLILAIAGGIAIQATQRHSADRLYQNNLASCERGNELRIESNKRVPAHRTEATVVLDFLHSAEQARRANYHETHQASDKQAAQQYHALSRRLKAHVHFQDVPVIDCQAVIQKP